MFTHQKPTLKRIFLKKCPVLKYLFCLCIFVSQSPGKCLQTSHWTTRWAKENHGNKWGPHHSWIITITTTSSKALGGTHNNNNSSSNNTKKSDDCIHQTIVKRPYTRSCSGWTSTSFSVTKEQSFSSNLYLSLVFHGSTRVMQLKPAALFSDELLE